MNRPATALALVAVLGSAGCVGEGDASGPGGGSEPRTRASVAGAIDRLSGLRCSPDEQGRWQARAVLTNDSDSATSFALTLSVIDPSNSAVYGERTVRAEVGARSSKRIAVRNIATGHTKKGRCVPFLTGTPN